jgi:hypothetical protein
MKKSFLILFLTLLTGFLGCGDSYDKKQVKKENEKNEKVMKKEIYENSIISKLNEKYEPIKFPPDSLSTSFYTYDIQKHFDLNKENNILFYGYLDDIEIENENIFIIFDCVIENEFLLNPNIIKFRFNISEEQAKNFLRKENRIDPIDKFLGYLREPEYIVVGKAHYVSKIRKYEITSSPISKDESEIEIETVFKYLANGNYFEAVRLKYD